MATATGGPRRLTRKERQAQTRERLLEAAGRVFIRRGFVGSSVEEICAEAGYTRGAFYSNFESKQKMFVELLHARIFDGYRRILEDTPPDLSPLEQLRLNAHRVAEVQENEEGRWLFQLWLECLTMASRNREFAKLVSTFWSANRKLTADRIASLYRSRGEKPPIPPKNIASALTAIDIGLAIQHMVDPGEVPLDAYPQVYELLFAPVFEGGEDE